MLSLLNLETRPYPVTFPFQVFIARNATASLMKLKPPQNNMFFTVPSWHFLQTFGEFAVNFCIHMIYSTCTVMVWYTVVASIWYTVYDTQGGHSP